MIPQLFSPQFSNCTDHAIPVPTRNAKMNKCENEKPEGKKPDG
jgi:hypothetical protein